MGVRKITVLKRVQWKNLQVLILLEAYVYRFQDTARNNSDRRVITMGMKIRNTHKEGY